MDSINNTLAGNILKYRKKCGLTQEELANKLGVTFQAISKWETAKSAPDINLLPKMAEIFGCSIDNLFSFIAQNNTEELNVWPNFTAPEELKEYISDQLKHNLDNNGSANKFISVISDNISGNFNMTDENIDRLVEAYRDLYKGMLKK